jgi:hypothetical protein
VVHGSRPLLRDSRVRRTRGVASVLVTTLSVMLWAAPAGAAAPGSATSTTTGSALVDTTHPLRFIGVVVGILAVLWFVLVLYDRVTINNWRRTDFKNLMESLLEAAKPRQGDPPLSVQEVESLARAISQPPKSAPGLTRSILAIGLLTLIGIALVALLVGDSTVSGDMLKTLVTALTATLTTILGFYFGSKTASDAASSSAQQHQAQTPTVPRAAGPAQAVGTGVISGTVDGAAITSTATVTFAAQSPVPDPPSGATSAISARPTPIVANGTSTSAVTVQLRDASGNDLVEGGYSVALQKTDGTPLDVTDNGDGTYSATLTAPTAPGSDVVSGTVNGAAITSTATVGYVAQPPPPADPSGVTSTIDVRPTSIAADGTSTSAVTVQLKDASGNDLLSGGPVVRLTTTGGTVSPELATDNGDGTYSATLTSPAQ